MLAAVSRPIGPDETSEEVERDLAVLGARLLLETTDKIAAGLAVETPQDESAATYAPRLIKDDGAIDWTQPAQRVHDLIRGLHPWPLAFSYLNGRRVILRRSAVVKAESQQSAGVVIEASGDRFVVGAGGGAIALSEIQLEGKRPATAREAR